MANATDSDHVMVTTIDNPYNPFTQYDEWFALDRTLGYHTPALLARYCFSSDDLSELDEAIAIEQGIDDLIKDNPIGKHRKVRPSDYS